MNTEKLLQFFNSKLKMVPEIKKLNDDDNPEFIAWWNTILSTCDRMGEAYKKRGDSIIFYPGVVFSGRDNSAAFAKAYQRGMDEAEAFLKSIIEELDTWGYESNSPKKASQNIDQDKIILNLTISQQQIQQIIQTINLDSYDEATKEKVTQLFEELNKAKKDKSKISATVKWLADKSVDALIAILLAKASLT